MTEYNYRKINHEVMTNTKTIYETLPELREAIARSIASQYIVGHDDTVTVGRTEAAPCRITVTGRRTFQASGAYPGKKVAALNFASNHSIGGAPFYAGAQEESLCRCSTLLPCLEALREPFYDKHIGMYRRHEIDHMGNDDLIYTPDVVVFKTDELAEPVYPVMMRQADWYTTDVITCAAPDFRGGEPKPDDYEAQIRRRIRKILDVAESQGVEVLILGAWGCGAFRNPVDVIAPAFIEELKGRGFETVEFALSHRGDLAENAFARALQI